MGDSPTEKRKEREEMRRHGTQELETVARQRLGDLLIKANLIDDIQLRVALKAQKDGGGRLGTTLVELGFIDETVLAAFLSKQADMPCINIGNIRIPREIIGLVPKEVALKRNVVPIRRAGNTVYLAMADPFHIDSLRDVEDALPKDMAITPMIAPEVSLKKCLMRHYEPEKFAADEETHELLGIVDELEHDTLLAVSDKIDKLAIRVDKLASVVDELHAFLIKAKPDESN